MTKVIEVKEQEQEHEGSNISASGGVALRVYAFPSALQPKDSAVKICVGQNDRHGVEMSRRAFRELCRTRGDGRISAKIAISIPPANGERRSITILRSARRQKVEIPWDLFEQMCVRGLEYLARDHADIVDTAETPAMTVEKPVMEVAAVA